MTEYEAMTKYGDDEGYILCYDCPCYINDEVVCEELKGHCNGKTDAYKAIVRHLGDIEPTTYELEPTDMVNHPPHYTQGGMECIDEMILLFGKPAVMDFCICNAWKYRKRALHKNGQEDLDKADWYLKKYKELSESE